VSSARSAAKEILGGVAASLVAIPQSIALGMLAFSPLGPEYARMGIMAGLLAQALGNIVVLPFSAVRCQIVGARASATAVFAGIAALLVTMPELRTPAGPDVPMVLSLLALTMIAAGTIQATLGFTRLGSAIKFVPYPVVAGFMNGVALLILFTQLRPALGLEGAASLRRTLSELDAAQWGSIATFATTMAAILVATRMRARVAPIFVGLVAGVLCHVALAAAFGDAAAGRVVGALPPWHGSLDVLQRVATLDWSGAAWYWVGIILPGAAFLAVVCALDGLLAAVVVDSVAGSRHDPNRELMAQGLANTVLGATGMMPVVGNTVTPIACFMAGARTRAAVVAHIAVMLAVVLFLMPTLARIPVAALAGVMVYIAAMLIDRWSRELVGRLRTSDASRREIAANLAVVVLVAGTIVLANVMIAVGVGVSAAVLMMLVKLSGTPVLRKSDGRARSSLKVRTPAARELLQKEAHRIRILELHGELFFGTAERLRVECDAAFAGSRFLILDLRRVHQIDASGARALEMVGRSARGRQTEVLLGHVRRDQARGRLLQALGVAATIPPQSWFADLDRALESAEDRLLEEAGLREDADEIAPDDMALFKDLTPVELQSVRRLLERSEFAHGAPVFREGDEGDRLHLIAKGRVSIKVRLDDDTRARRLATFNPGVMFGEMALLERQRRSADAFARGEHVVLYTLSAERFETLAHDDPALAIKVYRNLSRELAARLRITTGALRSLD